MIVELNKDLRFNGENYKIWSKHIQIVLVEQKVFNQLNKNIKSLGSRLMNQQKVFDNKWDVKAIEVRVTMLSTVDDL